MLVFVRVLTTRTTPCLISTALAELLVKMSRACSCFSMRYGKTSRSNRSRPGDGSVSKSTLGTTYSRLVPP